MRNTTQSYYEGVAMCVGVQSVPQVIHSALDQLINILIFVFDGLFTTFL